ncbi:thioredoxin 1 [Nannocystis exedens]|uniref:Thioredoxin 1 n=1 Tax=Nannocystis exedens TaxID=54 RepID=A0A1I2GMD8_9BACT|nr:thioredoxin family protein [Nannocystis exedens]PCC68716.1 thiol reductase thioredoxin [Nannocystis exedens]SFF19094.1 thioredoxin 1 [Nannocystis exedens]
MSFAPEYLDPDHAPRREQLDQRRGLVLVEFGTAWCGYCQAAAAGVRSLLERYPAVEHVKVEDGPGRPLGRSFRVKLWPNFVLMRDGAVVHQLARPSRGELADAFQRFAGSEAAGG